MIRNVKKTLKNNIQSRLDYNHAPYNYMLYNNNRIIKVYYRLQDRLYIIKHNHKRSSNTQLYDIPYTKQLLNESRFLEYEDSKILAQ